MVSPIDTDLATYSPLQPAESVNIARKKIQDGKVCSRKDEVFKEVTGKGEMAAAMTGQELERIREAINGVLKNMNIGLDFKTDKESQKLVVEVMNLETEEIIRKIPPDTMLQVAMRMQEMAGVFVDDWG